MAITKKEKSKHSRPAPESKPKSKQPIKLPSKVNLPPANLGEYILCLYGEKGIGKTSLASQFPGSLTFMFEPGRRNLPIKQVPQVGEPPLTWERFVEYIDLLTADGPTEEFSTINVDTIDRAYEACVDKVCADQGLSHPGEIKDFGRTWDLIKREFEAQLNRLHYAGFGLIFTSHSKVQEIESHSGTESYNLITPTCKNQAWGYLKAVADFAFYYGYGANRTRTLTLRGNELVWSACGTDGHFNTKTRRAIAELILPDDPKAAYETFMDAYDNMVHPSKCAVLQTDEEKAQAQAARKEKLNKLKKK